MKSALLLLIVLTAAVVFAQSKKQDESADYLNFSWKKVATKMQPEWYATNEAKLVAENVLLCQKDIGGWAKNEPYHHIYSETEKEQVQQSKAEIGGTFDNGATIRELRFLAKLHLNFNDNKYKKAFKKGLDYIFMSQYKNGGWPQFYPVRKGESVTYSAHITYNDNAMIKIMWFHKDITSDNPEFASFQFNEEFKARAQNAFNNGIQCILKTQIIVHGIPTVWCAQHNEITLAPAKARKYELASFSGSESVGLVHFLMSLDNPSVAIVSSVNGAIQWFEGHKIEGITRVKKLNEYEQMDLVVVPDRNASPLWARFYDLQTGKPFFCVRDGIKKNTLAEISYERRNGYRWYTNSPSKILENQSEWMKKYNIN
jgi:PelA/Pel-15E family pectate lyase